MKCTCELCSFRNQKATATAIIIKNNQLLLVKRSHDPLKGYWDLPGGYAEEGETPEEAVRREVKEELNVDADCTFIKALPGISYWKEDDLPVLSHFFLVDIKGEIKLSQENSEYQFFDLKTLNPKDVAFDSNQAFVQWIKDNFTFDLARVRELTKQLDSSATIDEQYLYKAILDGFVSRIYEGEKLIGMGWIFSRQTMLRRQAVIEDMIVDDNYRGKGYGKKMMLELIEWAKKEKMDMIELTSNPARIAANELYKKVGFQLHPTNHYLYKVSE